MANVTVHVLDDDQEPVEGKEVTLMFPHEFLGIGTHLDEWTDEDGIAEFDGVPIGSDHEIHVAGKMQLQFDISDINDDEDFTVTI